MLMQKMTIETQEINGITSVEINGFADAIMRHVYYDDQIPTDHAERVRLARWFKKYERYIEGVLGDNPLFTGMVKHPKQTGIIFEGETDWEAPICEILDCLSALGYLIDIHDNGTGHVKLIDGEIAQ